MYILPLSEEFEASKWSKLLLHWPLRQPQAVHTCQIQTNQTSLWWISGSRAGVLQLVFMRNIKNVLQLASHIKFDTSSVCWLCFCDVLGNLFAGALKDSLLFPPLGEREQGRQGEKRKRGDRLSHNFVSALRYWTSIIIWCEDRCGSPIWI